MGRKSAFPSFTNHVKVYSSEQRDLKYYSKDVEAFGDNIRTLENARSTDSKMYTKNVCYDRDMIMQGSNFP